MSLELWSLDSTKQPMESIYIKLVFFFEHEKAPHDPMKTIEDDALIDLV